ncbi:MAG: type I-C CRISPR-associated protein Cas8c/Csd1 [Deltaproteobacteria bacterium]|jgi:CRISPR-associated protein Csd1|nr:type I-C CRISPR-associated protein Cas8c/Csd1 [Deltaproteobacteria bacterium]
MILQALNSYYQRLTEREDSDAAPEGFAPQSVSFALQLDGQGGLLDVLDLRELAAKGKKLVPRKMLVPDLGEAKGSGIKPTYLWGNSGYVLGRDDKSKSKRTADCLKAFRRLHEKLLEYVAAPEAAALLRFLRNPPAHDPHIEEKWADMATANLVFRVGRHYLHEIPALRAVWFAKGQNAEDVDAGICLVTGEHTRIAKLHPFIKGVPGGQTGGAAISAYNQDSFESFGKKKNFNAPVGKTAAFGYVTALNYLLSSPEQRLRLGAATVVCWAERDTPLEDNLLPLLNGREAGTGGAEVDTASAQERAVVLRRLGRGLPVTEAWPGLDPAVRIYVLALKPNAARLSVGFFLQGSAGEFLESIRSHYANLAIERRLDADPEFPSVWQITRAVLGKHKDAKDIQRLGDELIEGILSGHAYPAYLLPMCLQRLRSGDNINSVRTGLIKAMLIRNHAHKEELMSLNTEHPSPAYQLGRLFALLAGVQRKAIGQNINADIRDKYYGSASSTPAVVFPLLLRNAQHHISKAKAGGYDKLIRDVLEHIDNEFPAHLDLQAQGLFALGYYHQRVAKAAKSDDGAMIENTSTAQQQLS